MLAIELQSRQKPKRNGIEELVGSGSRLGVQVLRGSRDLVSRGIGKEAFTSITHITKSHDAPSTP